MKSSTPNATKTIKEDAYRDRSELTTVVLGDGLEEIRAYSFNTCRSLHEIVIPNAAKSVKDGGITVIVGGVDNCNSQRWDGGHGGGVVTELHIARSDS
jgi:hypothetical protein